MKIDRRSFLSLGIGVTAGITLSPLPWKLTDDLSIWTQMWPWTPVPKDGAESYTNSTCTLCPGGCGISVRMIDGRPVKIEGMKGHPVNDGKLCLLGLSGLQLLYSPSRVTAPMKRVGNRGENKWKEISWNEAVKEIAENLMTLRSKGLSDTLGVISGTDRGALAYMFDRFLMAFGSRNFFRTDSFENSYEMVFRLMHGTWSNVGFDLENSDYVLSFGSGIIEGWAAPVRSIKANSMWKARRAKVVQIEPRLSVTAAKSDKWITINPGTEPFLALGLAHVLIKEGLTRKNFVEKFSTGYEDWKNAKGEVQKGFKTMVLEGYSPEKTSELTGVPVETIVTLAKHFATAQNPLAVCGKGEGDIPGNLSEYMAVHALNALVGNINGEGGVWGVPKPDYVRWDTPMMDFIAQTGTQEGRVDGAGSDKYPLARSLLNRLPEVINSSKNSPIQALFVANANPCYTMPDTSATIKAFNRIPFIVSFSSFLDETAQQSDLILPNHIYLERYEDLPAPAGFNKPIIGLAKPVVKPQYNTKNTGDALIAIAKSMGSSMSSALPWDNFEGALEQALGEKWKPLVKNGFIADTNYSPQAWEIAFETPTKKFEFMPTVCMKAGGKIEDLYTNQIEPEGNEGSYPLTLIPYDTLRLAHGYIGNPPFVTKTVEDTILKKKDIFVEVNPKTAKPLGLKEGACAELVTPKGKAKVKIHLYEGIMPGLVGMPRGLGHTAYDEYLSGKGVNVNELYGSVEDPISGLDAAWGIRAKLSKA